MLYSTLSNYSFTKVLNNVSCFICAKYPAYTIQQTKLLDIFQLSYMHLDTLQQNLVFLKRIRLVYQTYYITYPHQKNM